MNEFYIIPEELFRMGNSKSPRLSNVRSRDVTIMNGKIIANGKGVSVFDREGINQSPMTGWVWKFPSNTRLPIGLKLVHDKKHHYCISPTRNMLIEEYKSLLEKMSIFAKKVFRKEGEVI